MDALSVSGDRASAIQHARVYELLVEQELDLPPDAEVIALAQRLRRVAEEPAPAPAALLSPALTTATLAPARPFELSPAISVADPAPVTQQDIVPPVPSVQAAIEPPRTRPWARPAGFALLGAAVVVAGLALKQRSAHTALPAGATAVAIGHIAAFGADSAQSSLTAPLTDLLTTSLARVPNIRVVSHGRMLELMHSTGTANDTSAGGFVNAAAMQRVRCLAVDRRSVHRHRLVPSR